MSCLLSWLVFVYFALYIAHVVSFSDVIVYIDAIAAEHSAEAIRISTVILAMIIWEIFFMNKKWMIGRNSTSFGRSKKSQFIFEPPRFERALFRHIVRQLGWLMPFWWTYWANPNQIVFSHSRRIGWYLFDVSIYTHLNVNYERFNSVPFSWYLFRWLTHNKPMHTLTNNRKNEDVNTW